MVCCNDAITSLSVPSDDEMLSGISCTSLHGSAFIYTLTVLVVAPNFNFFLIILKLGVLRDSVLGPFVKSVSFLLSSINGC